MFSPQRRQDAKILPVDYLALFFAPWRLCGKQSYLITASLLRIRRALLFLAVLLAPLCALAAGYDRQQPVHLRADRIDIDQKTGVSLYRGHVLFTQGTLKLTAARAQVVNRGNVLQTITAEGAPVTFRHRPVGLEEFIEGEAGRAVYHAPTQRVDLFKNVSVQRGRDTFRGAVLHYDIEGRSLIAESDAGQRVYVALAPRVKAALPGAAP